MKIVKLSRKFVLIVIGTIFSISIFAQSPEREKRIYLLDLTGSMEGRGTGVTYNILSTVKNNLSATLDGIEDKNTEIVIIPFTNIPHEAIHSFISEKDVLHKSVEEIKVLPGDTNIADAWEEGIRNLDSTKVNYIFLLTDGLHNTGPSKEVLFERLSCWQNISTGHYYYAFYVMLTPNAKEMEICSIVDSTSNMWLIESMDINASLIKTSINTRKNIYNNPKASISFSTNNSRVKLEDLNLNLSLQDNDCYEIRNIQKSLMGDSYSFEIVEKKPKLEEPLDTTFNLKISYDQEAFPFVFMTPDNVEMEIINQGIRKADITGLGRRNKPVEKISFKKTTYKEPFQGPFRWCRRYLEPTLNIPPYKWCVPDTACTTMPILISFNEEAMRSHSRIRLEMKGAYDMASTHLITYNDGKTEYISAFAEPDTVDISVKILPGIPTTKFEGRIVAYVENIDEVNSFELNSNDIIIGTWNMKYKKSFPFWLWFLWVLTAVLIIFITYSVIKFIVKGTASLFMDIVQFVRNQFVKVSSSHTKNQNKPKEIYMSENGLKQHERQNGLTPSQKERLKKRTGWSDAILDNISSIEEANIYIKAKLKEACIGGQPALIRQDIDWKAQNCRKEWLKRELADWEAWKDYNNADLIGEGYPPRDSNGDPYCLHHIGQRQDSPYAELTYNEHMGDGNNTILHKMGKESEIDRGQFDKEKSKYWQNRYNNFSKRELQKIYE